jgi:hypothetical protein
MPSKIAKIAIGHANRLQTRTIAETKREIILYSWPVQIDAAESRPTITSRRAN